MNTQNSSESTNTPVTWQRALIRSGFHFQNIDEAFDFTDENEVNRCYLYEILSALGQQQYFDGTVFSPSVMIVDEQAWLGVIEKLHTGSEGGPSDMQNIELRIMDTYMAGIVRWINAAGFKTRHSCDGHQRQKALMTFAQPEYGSLFDFYLRTISDNNWKLGNRWFSKCGELSPRLQIQQDREAFDTETYDRVWLLDVAEALHSRQHELRDFVKAAQRLEQSSH